MAINEMIRSAGSSRFNVVDETSNGFTSAVIPKTSAMFVMLEPSALPTAVFILPFAEAMAETTISGAEDPIATIVSPIIIGEMPMFFANAEAPYTNRSALQLSTISPTRKMTMFKSTTTCNRKYFARLSQKECHLPMLAAFYFHQILSIDVNFR